LKCYFVGDDESRPHPFWCTPCLSCAW